MRLVYAPGIRPGLEYLSRAVTEAAAEGRRVWVIIPDQMAVTVEDALSRKAPPAAQLYYDIVGFDRLADNVFRREGGVSYNYAGPAAEAVVMWRAIMDCGGSLGVFTPPSPELVPVMTRAVTELKQSMVSPSDLMRAAVHMPEPAKYIDIANIYETYDAMLHKTYDDRLSALTYAVGRVRSAGDFFSGAEVIAFAFAGFTAQQAAMLSEAERGAEAVTVVVNVPGDASDVGRRPELDGIVETRSRLRAIAAAAGKPFYTEALPCEREDEITELTRELFGVGGVISEEEPEKISLVAAESLRAEAEAAAVEIAAAVRGGMRYRDIAVCTGSVENYRGIIEPIFESYSIPLHMSARVDAERLPATSALLSALRVVTCGWRRDDIAAYIKTGMTGLSTDEEDDLLLYMMTWSLGGRKFYEPAGGAWSMNPDGYTADWTEEGERMLASVNASRTRVTGALLPLAEAFSDATDARVKTEAVKCFLAALPRESGDEVGARLADEAANAAEAIALSLPEGSCGAEDYVSCLRLVIGTLSLGTIPGRTDEVELSDTVGMRGAGHLLVIMLGVCDGVMPAGAEDGFFSDAERGELEGAGVRLGERAAFRSAMEYYNFCRCAADAEDRLVFIYRKGSSPAVIERVIELFPRVRVRDFPGNFSVYDIYSEAGATSRYLRIRDASSRRAIAEATADSPVMRRIRAGEDVAIADASARVSEATAAELFGGDISFSQTKIEKFADCRFAFYCDYVLGLRERRRAEVNGGDIGTFIHAVLEGVFRSGIMTRGADDEELAEAARGVIAEYLARTCPDLDGNARMRGLFRRLERSVLLFLRAFRDEFAQSRFRPVLFEVPFGLGEGMPPLRVPLGDGKCAVLRGIADRVDAYRDAEGRVYVRVVDYKAKKLSFRPDDIAEGYDIQLPLYLYTICSEADAETLGGQRGDVLVPAGFLYIGVKPEDQTEKKCGPLPKRGILLADEAVLRAQDRELSGNYIPVTLKKDGGFKATEMLTEPEGFDRIKDELFGAVRRISAGLRSGAADAIPTQRRRGGYGVCDFCAAKVMCRRSETDGERDEEMEETS